MELTLKVIHGRKESDGRKDGYKTVMQTHSVTLECHLFHFPIIGLTEWRVLQYVEQLCSPVFSLGQKEEGEDKALGEREKIGLTGLIGGGSSLQRIQRTKTTLMVDQS